MENREFTQFGTFSVAIFAPIVLLSVGLLIRAGLQPSPVVYVLLTLFVVFFVCLLTFYKLKIIVDNTTVSFKLGIGLFGKSYNISDINYCKPVKNSAIYGIGIRKISNGWLYNVSGLKAIELSFKNSKKIVRIGTNNPFEVCEFIQSIINKESPTNFENSSFKKSINPSWLILFILFFVIGALFISSEQETRIKLENDGLTIKGFYGQSIPYNELTHVDTVSILPKIVLRKNGYAFGKTRSGIFKIQDKSSIRLFIKKGSIPYILIESQGREPIYINFKEREKTLKLYDELKKYCFL
jgi:fumarate reductase subunit D